MSGLFEEQQVASETEAEGLMGEAIREELGEKVDIPVWILDTRTKNVTMYCQ